MVSQIVGVLDHEFAGWFFSGRMTALFWSPINRSYGVDQIWEYVFFARYKENSKYNIVAGSKSCNIHDILFAEAAACSDPHTIYSSVRSNFQINGILIKEVEICDR